MPESPKVLSPDVIKITQQYLRTTSAMEKMFAEAQLRTDKDRWRYDGVGSCDEIDNKLQSELGIQGPAADHLVQLREQRAAQFPGKSKLTGCPYHREGIGCVLGSLKAPVCITFPDNKAEWRERFGIIFASDYDSPDKYAIRTLEAVLGGRTLVNETPLNNFIGEVESLTARIKQEPRLHHKSFKDRTRLFWRGLKSLPEDLRRKGEFFRR